MKRGRGCQQTILVHVLVLDDKYDPLDGGDSGLYSLSRHSVSVSQGDRYTLTKSTSTWSHTHCREGHHPLPDGRWGWRQKIVLGIFFTAYLSFAGTNPHVHWFFKTSCLGELIHMYIDFSRPLV